MHICNSPKIVRISDMSFKTKYKTNINEINHWKPWYIRNIYIYFMHLSDKGKSKVQQMKMMKQPKVCGS